jgi:hypothetical protein
MRRTCLYCSTFDGAVMLYYGVTKFGQGRAAA